MLSPTYAGLYHSSSRTTADTYYITHVGGALSRCTCPHGSARHMDGKPAYCWHARTAHALCAAHLAALAADVFAAPAVVAPVAA